MTAPRDVDALLTRYETSPAMREYASHNHEYWRLTHGGRGLAESAPVEFDPIAQYWSRTECRLLVSFFVDRFREAYAPAEGLRNLAFRVFRHFDEAAKAGRFGVSKVIRSGDWPGFLELARPVASELPEMPEYGRLRDIWGKQLKAPTIREELLRYFDEAAEEPRLGELEGAFYLRLAWFPYLGLASLDQLQARQGFFAGYYRALTSTNSYVTGGSISFAPVVQNNPSKVLLGYLKRWLGTETPGDTKFVVEGKSSTKDRSTHASVIELYCILNLHRAPILNGRSKEVIGAFGLSGDLSPYDQILRAGGAARSMLGNRSAIVAGLSQLFLQMLEAPSSPGLMMEGIRRQPIASKYPADLAAQVDPVLQRALDEFARKAATELTELDRATAMYHLLLDASIYEEQQAAVPLLPPPPPAPLHVPVVSSGYRVETTSSSSVREPVGHKVQLPASLERIANDALGYLRAGSHVLLAGPPGTGKTTVAQFVGLAWKRNLTSVPLEMFASEAPITTVATSAWSPFHTTGGLFPTADNRVVPVPGVFVEELSETKGEWTLKGECIVLDEMNRADLDRCIGELYPLLSGSVARVRPAGIPGINWIVANERFRIVATVNDASLDDVVFPISEGLARRFVRLELHGATLEALKGLLSRGKPDPARLAAGVTVIERLFDVCKERKLTTKTEDGEHLPFGVGYFGIVQRWVSGQLQLSLQFEDEDLEEQATTVIRTSLASVVRVRGLAGILAALDVGAE